MSELWDAPNQQVVRGDNSAPWDEGTGGETGTVTAGSPLDTMTKAELLAYADENGISVSADMTKADIRAAIDEAG